MTLFVITFFLFLKKWSICLYLADKIFDKLCFNSMSSSCLELTYLINNHVMDYINHLSDSKFSKLASFVFASWVIILQYNIFIRIYYCLLDIIIFDELTNHFLEIFFFLNSLTFFIFFLEFICFIFESNSDSDCLLCILLQFFLIKLIIFE